MEDIQKIGRIPHIRLSQKNGIAIIMFLPYKLHDEFLMRLLRTKNEEVLDMVKGTLKFVSEYEDFPGVRAEIFHYMGIDYVLVDPERLQTYFNDEVHNT